MEISDPDRLRVSDSVRYHTIYSVLGFIQQPPLISKRQQQKYVSRQGDTHFTPLMLTNRKAI